MTTAEEYNENLYKSMETRFNKQFDSLSKLEQANYARAFTKKLNKTVESINKSNHCPIKEDDQFDFNTAIRNDHARKESLITASKIKNLDVFNYCNIDEIEVLTPEMENGIKNFVSDFLRNKFEIVHSFSGYHERINDSIFRSDKNITKEGIVECIHQRVDEIEKEEPKIEEKQTTSSKIRNFFKR